MEKVKDKKILAGADFVGFPLKETVVANLKVKDWEVTDVGVKFDSDHDDTDLMFHRIGLRAGSLVSEGEFERAALYREIMTSEYRGTFNLELKPPSKLNDKAKKAYYLLAYETARTIMER